VYLLTANGHARCLAVLREGLQAGQPEVVGYSAEALTGAHYAFEVQPVLLDLLADPIEDRVRAGLVGELVRSGDAGAIVFLQDLLLAPEQEARMEAARTLFRIGQSGDPALLQAIVEGDEDGRLQVYAAAALQRAGRATTIGFIRGALDAEDPLVRSVATEVLLIVGDATDIPALQAGLERAEFQTDRAYLERALAVLGDAGGRRAVLGQLGHPDSVIRAHAAQAVAEGWLTDASSRLYALLDDPVLAVRVRAAHALLVLSDPESPALARRVRLDR
jgi:sialidase-1